tara:strand:- start:31 stop:276 length:246 start_codon:yes stop_codon:yes gene_type:complete
MLRITEELVDWGFFDNLARIHDSYSVSHRSNNRKVMGDQKHPHLTFPLSRSQVLQDLRLHGDVQRSRRFIGYQESWIKSYG